MRILVEIVYYKTGIETGIKEYENFSYLRRSG